MLDAGEAEGSDRNLAKNPARRTRRRATIGSELRGAASVVGWTWGSGGRRGGAGEQRGLDVEVVLLERSRGGEVAGKADGMGLATAAGNLAAAAGPGGVAGALGGIGPRRRCAR